MNAQVQERRGYAPNPALLKRWINDEQLATLRTLEMFGWSLRFVRRDARNAAHAWVYDPDHQRMARIGPDGVLDERPDLAWRSN
jgi:hypothetical protein